MNQQAKNDSFSGEAAVLNSAASRFTYQIGPHSILIETGVPAEVLTSRKIYAIPFAPHWCAGLTSLRGDLLPVVDMHRIVLGRSFGDDPHLLLLSFPQFPPVVITCDGYPRQLKLTDTKLTDSSKEKLPAWIPYALRHQGKTLLAADHPRLLQQLQQLSSSRA